jgi:hypothetical protein
MLINVIICITITNIRFKDGVGNWDGGMLFLSLEIKNKK